MTEPVLQKVHLQNPDLIINMNGNDIWEKRSVTYCGSLVSDLSIYKCISVYLHEHGSERAKATCPQCLDEYALQSLAALP